MDLTPDHNADPASAPDIDLTALAGTGDALLPHLNQLREAAPVHWSARSQCWIITGHAEVLDGLSGRLPLSNHQLPAALYRVMPHEELYRRLPNAMRYLTLMVTNLDGDDHVRIRKLMVKAVNRKLVESLRPYVQARVEHLLDVAEARGEVEFNEEIARMLPGVVILKLLGMDPDKYFSRLKAWSDGVTIALTSFNPRPEWLDTLESVVTDMADVFRAEIEDRRANPRADLITELLQACEGDARLSEDEMLGALILVIIAGHDTTTNSMTLGIRALASQPEAWAYWGAHPEDGVACAQELMRYIAMSAAEPRIVAEDFTWHDCQLKAGDFLMLLMAAGNRDPRVYASPETMDMSRPNDMVLTFGPGRHHCIGHLLAKLQLSEFFGALTRRFDAAEVIEEPEFLPNLIFRGVSTLRVRLRHTGS